MVKVFFNYRTVESPWGGGNSFQRSLKRVLEKMPDIQLVEDENDGYDVFFMNQLNRGPGRNKGQAQFISPWELGRISKYGDPSLLKMFGTFFSAKPKQGKKIVSRLTNLRSHSYNQAHNLRDWMLLTALKHTDMDIFQSEYIHNVFVGSGYKKTNYTVIYNGVNQSVFNLEGKKYWNGSFPVKIFSCAFAGRESKRFDIIADFSELKNVECVHIGTWPEGYNPKRVKLLSKMNQSEFVSMYKNEAHIFLHPAEKDICPNGVIEALSTGLPVIYRMPGGTAEIVGDCGVELNCSPRETLDKICSNYSIYVQNIKTNWHKYSIEYSAQLYADVFRKICC